MDNYNDKILMVKVSIVNDNSRKWHVEREMRMMLSYSQIGYQNLTLRYPTSKDKNQRKKLSIKELRDLILKEEFRKQSSKSAMLE